MKLTGSVIGVIGSSGDVDHRPIIIGMFRHNAVEGGAILGALQPVTEALKILAVDLESAPLCLNTADPHTAFATLTRALISSAQVKRLVPDSKRPPSTSARTTP